MSKSERVEGEYVISGDLVEKGPLTKAEKVRIGLGSTAGVLALAGTGVGLTAYAGTVDPLTVAGSPFLTEMFSAIHKGGAAMNHWVLEAGKNAGAWLQLAGKDAGAWLQHARKDIAQWSTHAFHSVAQFASEHPGVVVAIAVAAVAIIAIAITAAVVARHVSLSQSKAHKFVEGNDNSHICPKISTVL